MLYWMCHKSNRPPTELQLEHAIRRNFGGLEQEDLDPLEIFEQHLPFSGKQADIDGMTKEVCCSYCTSFKIHLHVKYPLSPLTIESSHTSP